MKLRIIFTLIICTFYTLAHSQQTRFVNDFSGWASTNFGPMNTLTTDSAVGMYAYVYPSQTLGQFTHNDSISSIEFFMNTNGNSITKANMQIWIASVSYSDFGPNDIHFDSTVIRAGATLVYDGNPSSQAGQSVGFKVFNFNKSNFVFDTTNGRAHLAIFIKYFQEEGCTGTISWRYERPADFGGYAINQAKTFRGNYPFPDSTDQTSGNHPETIINFPRISNDLQVNIIYALGKIPASTAAPEKIMARVTNTGSATTTTSNKVILNIPGLNAFTDTVSVPGIPSFNDTLIEFAAVNPTKITNETIEVKVSDDDDLSNNILNVTRFVTRNSFNHADPTAGASGGIGFNNSTGDFVAKFATGNASSVNQVKVRFTTANQPFQLCVYDDDNGEPGSLIYLTDTLTTNDSIYIVKIDPKLPVNGTFYIGIRQVGLTNVGFGFQNEVPVRPGAFFFTGPIGSTNWTPFSPGFNYKMMIEPRLQVAHDVGIERILPPFNDAGVVKYSTQDSFAPKALLGNYGSLDQNTPFDIICNIKRNGFVIYSDTITDTIASDRVKQIEFAKTFIPQNLGNHTCEVFTTLGLDLVDDNNNLTTDFKVAIEKDLGADIIFTPTISDTFEMNIDTIQPIVRIQNWGTFDQTGFDLVFQVLAGDKLIYEYITQESITAELTKIVPLDSFVCDTFGRLTMRAFTRLTDDEIPLNDTIYGILNIRKSKDIAILNIYNPKYDSIFVRGAAPFRPQTTISNVGDAFQDSVFVHYKIFNEDGDEVYYDKSYQPINILSSRLVSFVQTFNPDTVGKYDVLSYVTLKGDQDSRNDSLWSVFWVKVGNDVEATEIITPIPGGMYNVSYTPFNPTAKITNKGINEADSFNIVMEITKGSTIVYTSTVKEWLQVNQSKTITFPDVFDETDLGNYKVLLYTDMPNDDIRESDTLRSSFVISRFFDVGTRKIISPVSQDDYPYEDPIEIIVEVQNYGADTSSATFKLHVEIEVGSTMVYNQSTTVTLDSAQNRQITMPLDYQPSTGGAHVIRAFVAFTGDQRTNNDTIIDSYNVDNKISVERVGADNTLVAYPNPFGSFVTLKALTNINGDATITLTNSTGSVINTWGNVDLNSPFSINNLNNLPAGVYFITVQTSDGIYRFKLTKQE